MSQNARTFGIGFGLVFVAIGALSMIAMLLFPDGVKTAFWIAQIAASAFVFAGLSFIAQSLGRKKLAVAFSLAVVLVLGMTGMYFLFW